MIKGMFDAGALPTLERLVQFTGARHKVLTDDIANLSTPYFKPRDLSPKDFQKALRRAIDGRRETATPENGPLRMQDTQQLRFGDGRIDIRPKDTNDGILYHDQNNRDLERLMQHLAENTLTHSVGVELIRSEFGIMQTAIRERV